MSFAFRLIVIFAMISIAYGNEAADTKKTESVKQGKLINLYHFVFLPKCKYYIILFVLLRMYLVLSSDQEKWSSV